MERRHRRVRRRGTAIIGTVLALVLLLPTQTLAVSWGSTRTLTVGGDGYAYAGALAVSSGTVAHAVFEQWADGNWAAYYRRTSNSGSTWETPYRLSRAGVWEAGAPSIDASASGVNAVWLEGDDIFAGTDSVVMTRRSTDGGITWGAAVQLNADLDSPGYPKVARSGSRVAVAWTDARTGKVIIRVSTDGGATWGTRRSIGTSTNKPFGGSIYEAYPSVAWGTGVLYVAYMSASKSLKLVRSITTGSSWKTSVTLATNAYAKSPPSVAASASTAVVGYGAVTSTDSWTVYRRTTDKGATWGTVKSLNPSSSYRSWSPVIAVRSGRWMAVYERCTTSGCTRTNTVYRASTNGGSTWGTSSTASSRKRTWAWPGDVDVAGKTLVLYMDGNSTLTDIYVRQGS